MDDAQLLQALGMTALPEADARKFVAAVRAQAKQRAGLLAGAKKRQAALEAVIAESVANRKAILGE